MYAGIDIPSSVKYFVLCSDAENNGVSFSCSAGRSVTVIISIYAMMLLQVGISLFRAGHDRVIHYSAMVPYAEWMADALLLSLAMRCVCCLCEFTFVRPFAVDYAGFSPEDFLSRSLFIIVPKARGAEKTRGTGTEGSAYIDFPVNCTEIYEDYRRNPIELAKIRATIDTVHNDALIPASLLSALRGLCFS